MSLNISSSKLSKEEFYCPYSECMNKRKKHFSSKKFLTQHIGKVHLEKKYLCEKCGKGFGIDWWRKHHEKTCGVELQCDCSSKFTSLEALLTHARRTGHHIPENICSPKTKRCKTSIKSKENPVILLLQPIIQVVSCHKKSSNPVPILPKIVAQPVSSVVTSVTSANGSLRVASSNTISSIKLENDLSSLQAFSSSQMNSFDSVNVNLAGRTVGTQTLTESDNVSSSCQKENEKHCHKSTATQTSSELQTGIKTCESRASQCSRRKSKASVAVGNESTHTQTAESVVVKIKRKRSRRKSVAITTDTAMFTPLKNEGNNSVWPNFGDLICQNPALSASECYRNTMSTQTSYPTDKVLCDSQTITDEELDYTQNIKKEYGTLCRPFDLSVGVPTAYPLPDLQNNFVCDKLTEFGLFSSSSDLKFNHKFTETSDCFNAISSNTETCPLFDMFNDCQKSEASHQMGHPILSDIHTQTTLASPELDFNLLANMETQTTDDFALYDLLEFSDTETQTPWDDFPDIDESPLPPDQLSIEIQTDFSSLNSDFNPDLYEFFNGNIVQSMIDVSSSKQKSGVNIETQTQDRFAFPLLTNSESQTPSVNQLHGGSYEHNVLFNKTFS